jgi:hypothetical protein
MVMIVEGVRIEMQVEKDMIILRIQIRDSDIRRW